MNSPIASPQSISVAITGLGIYAATGDLPEGLWGAVAIQISCRSPVSGLSVSTDDEEEAEQPFYAPVPDLPKGLAPDSRMTIMATQALAQASEFLPGGLNMLRILILTLLPGPIQEGTGAEGLNEPEFAMDLRNAHPALKTAEVRFPSVETGAASHLATCMEELQQDRWDAVLFGGVDSLIDLNMIQSLVARGRCCTNLYPEGTLPGEGAGYLLLEKHNKADASLGLIAGLGHGREENHGQAADCALNALPVAIEQALEQGQCPSARVETAVLNMGNDVPSALEWHQVKRRLWPEPPEPEKTEHKMEELSPQISIGDTGAAALPLSLAIACIRFEFDFSPVERILVCDAGRGPARGAVFLKKSHREKKC